MAVMTTTGSLDGSGGGHCVGVILQKCYGVRGVQRQLSYTDSEVQDGGLLGITRAEGLRGKT